MKNKLTTSIILILFILMMTFSIGFAVENDEIVVDLQGPTITNITAVVNTNITISANIADPIVSATIAGTGVNSSETKYAITSNATTPAADSDVWQSSNVFDLVDPSTIYLWVKAVDNVGNVSINSEIASVDIIKSVTALDVSLSETKYTYDGTAKTPTVIAKDGDKILTKDTHFTVEYKNNTNAGTATVTVTGKGYYYGSIDVTFTIEKATPTITTSDDNITLKVGESGSVTYTYNGDGTTPTVTSGTPGVASVVSTDVASKTITVKALSTGTSIVTISIPGGSNYKDATKTFQVTVSDADISIVTDPSNVAVKENTAVSFSVTASGSNLTYQWYKATETGTGTKIDGATSATYSISAASVTKDLDGTYYYCDVTNSTGTVSSKRALLTVYYAPVITTHPASTSAIAGQTATFNVVVTDGNPTLTTYKWQYRTSSSGSWTNIDGATSASYTTPATTVNMNGYQYRVIVGNEQYVDAVTSNVATLSIGAKDLKSPDITAVLNQTVYTYDGTAKTPSATVKDGSIVLNAGTDYDITYSNNTNAGTATATLTGKGDYTGTRELTFTINKASTTLTVNMLSYTYAGTVSLPSVTGNTGNGAVTYYYNTANSNNNGIKWENTFTSTSVNAGTYYMYAVVEDTQNYIGGKTSTVAFTVHKADINPAVVMNDYTYGGTISKPSVTGNTENGDVKYYYNTTNTTTGGTEWTDAITSTTLDVGTYYMYAVVSTTTNYNGAVTATDVFEVKVSTGVEFNTTLNQDTFTYDGNPKKPGVVVTASGRQLTEGVDYDVAYENNTNAGENTAKVIITGKGNYAGTTDEVTFTIKQATASLTVTPTTINIEKGKSTTATVTYVGDGSVSAKSSSTSVATVSKSGNTLTIAGVNAGTATITVSVAGNTNYTSVDNQTITVNVYAKPTAPAITVTNVDGNVATETWSNKNLTITIAGSTITGPGTLKYQYSYNGTTWQDYTGPISYSTETVQQLIYAKAVNTTGTIGSLESEISTFTLMLDKTVPTSVNLETTTTTSSVTANVASVDASRAGIKKNEFYLDGVLKSTQASATYTFIGLGAGKDYTVGVKVRDNAGNVTDLLTKTVTTSTVSGAINLIPSTTAWTNQDVIVTIEWPETELIEQIKVGDGEWENYDKATYTIKENTTIYARLTDGENHGDPVSLVISNIDRQAPSGSIYIVPKYESYGEKSTNTNIVTIQVTATDDNSLADNMQMSFINEDVIPDIVMNDDLVWMEYDAEKIWEVSAGEGLKTVYVVFKDEAGNQSYYIIDPAPQPLHEVAEVGDLVEYPVNYTDLGTATFRLRRSANTSGGWRVLSKDADGTVTLVSTGTPLVYEYTNADTAIEDLTTNFLTTEYAASGFANSSLTYTFAYEQVVPEANGVAPEVRAMTEEDIYAVTGATSMSLGNAMDLANEQYEGLFTNGASYILATPTSSNDGVYYINSAGEVNSTAGETDVVLGVRPVLKLKPDTMTKGKVTSSGAWTIINESEQRIFEKPTIEGTYTYNGEKQIVALKNFVPSKMTIMGDAESTEVGTYTITVYLNDTINTMWSDGTTAEYELTWEIKEAKKTANAPQIDSTIMKAIYWNEDGTEEYEADSFTTDMYNYAKGDGVTDSKQAKWANAKTIEDESYWVWIPRYAYKITYYTDSAKTKVSNSKTQYGSIDILFLKGTSYNEYYDDEGNVITTGLPAGYKVHPAFQAMTTTEDFERNPLGKWDTELEGIWVAKYELSMEKLEDGKWENVNENVRITDDKSYRMVSKPSLDSWTLAQPFEGGAAYTNSAAMFSELNSHEIKNSEWGAVAYLTYSAYGRNGNELGVNQCNYYKTGKGPGLGSSTVSNGTYSIGLYDTTYAWNTTQGQLSSTTGNIYGIYDLSGGVYENTASYVYNNIVEILINGLKEEGDSSSLLVSTDMKSKQIYTVGTSDNSANNYTANSGIYGDAIYETSISANGSNGGWCNDITTYPSSVGFTFIRGGYFDAADKAGIFSVTASQTATTTLGYGTRAVLCIAPDSDGE